MAERPEHVRVLALLERMDDALVREADCWFAGGTAVALRCDEFRLSRDVDFLCASVAGYRMLRERVFERGGAGLFKAPVPLAREARADRYGIRLAVSLDGGDPIKLEIVSEGRIALAGVDDSTLPVPRLCDVDLVAEKLLANEDRLFDDASLGRDAIDLIMLEHALGGLPSAAWDKAALAYGASVEVAWKRALERLRDRPEKLAKWLDVMDVSPVARQVVEAKLRTLPARDEG